MNEEKSREKSIKEKAKEKIAVIRIRGNVNVRGVIKDTLDMLKLMKKNYCVVYDKTSSIVGMLKKVKDYVTWGEIKEQTLKLLVDKRGKKDKKGFALQPPRGGFERKA